MLSFKITRVLFSGISAGTSFIPLTRRQSNVVGKFSTLAPEVIKAALPQEPPRASAHSTGRGEGLPGARLSCFGSGCTRTALSNLSLSSVADQEFLCSCQNRRQPLPGYTLRAAGPGSQLLHKMQEMFTQAGQAALHDQKDKGRLLDF